jgi:hypothetical protein
LLTSAPIPMSASSMLPASPTMTGADQVACCRYLRAGRHLGRKNRLRRKTNFAFRFNSMSLVQPSRQKYFYFFFSEVVVYS